MTNEQLVAAVAAFLTGGGGLVAFLKWAFTQWLLDRKQEREERRGEVSALFDIQLTLQAMLERDRIREERRKRETGQPQSRGVPQGVWDEPTTDVHQIKREMREIPSVRRPTPAAGVRLPRPGTRNEDR